MTKGVKYGIMCLGEKSMRILPDIHFRTNYKKRYEANYGKLTERRQKKAKEKAEIAAEHPNAKRQRFVGAIFFFIVFGVIVLISWFLYASYSSKESEINTLVQNIHNADDTIKAYQVVASDERIEQLNEAVSQIVTLQTQYLTANYDAGFAAKSARYLGRYAENWAEAVDENAVWHGYLDLSEGDTRTASGVFILSQDNSPVVVVTTKLATDAAGNFTEITSLRRAVLV